MEKISKIFICIILPALLTGCEKERISDVSIRHIDFYETYRNEVLNLPNGVFIPDNPNFDFDDPSTWTGNAAQYVYRNYMYSVSYSIENSGSSYACDVEIDLRYIFDNGDESVETIYLGDMDPDDTHSYLANYVSTNRQLVEIRGEVYWYD